MKMKKIVIISYFFPPCAKAGSHRPYSMAESLPKLGWQPIFIAPQKGYYGRISRLDNSLLDIVNKFLVYRFPFFYPFNNEKNIIIPRLIRRLWESLLVPDGKVLWNRNVKKGLKEIVRNHEPDVFFITSTPWSTFLLAPYLKKEFSIPIVLDYRDPWTLTILNRNSIIKKINLYLEKKSVASADLITTASYHMIDYIKQSLGPLGERKKFVGFPYGFNGDFFKKEILKIEPINPNLEIKASFAGFVHGSSSAKIILSGIKFAIQKDKYLAKKLKIDCFGTLFGQSGKAQRLIEEYNLNSQVSLYPFLSYNEFLKVLRKSSFLILPLGQSGPHMTLYPTKFFDYLGVKRPILYVGDDGQVSETIKKCNAGLCSKPDPSSVADALIQISHGIDKQTWYSKQIEYNNLDRKNIFHIFCNELNKLC